MADSDVKLKHKVQLRKKIEETEHVSEPRPIAPGPKQPRRNSRMWIWIFSLIVIGLLVWWIIATIRTEDKTVEDENQTQTVEKVNEQPETVEGGMEEPAVSDQLIPEETTPRDIQETEVLTPTPSTTKEEPSVSVPVTSQPGKSSPATTQVQSNASINVSNDVETEAMKVIRGDYGVGQERKDKLGNKYQPIQNRVNELKKEGVF